MIPAAGSQARPITHAEHTHRDRRGQLAPTRDQPDGQPAHRGREDHVEPQASRVGDAPAEQHADGVATFQGMNVLTKTPMK